MKSSVPLVAKLVVPFSYRLKQACHDWHQADQSRSCDCRLPADPTISKASKAWFGDVGSQRLNVAINFVLMGYTGFINSVANFVIAGS